MFFCAGAINFFDLRIYILPDELVDDSVKVRGLFWMTLCEVYTWKFNAFQCCPVEIAELAVVRWLRATFESEEWANKETNSEPDGETNEGTSVFCFARGSFKDLKS